MGFFFVCLGGGGGKWGARARGRHRNDFFPHHIYCAQSKVNSGGGGGGQWGVCV